MQVQDLGQATSGAQTSVQCTATPFLPGSTVLVQCYADPACSAITGVVVATSPDDSTYTTVATLTEVGEAAAIELDEYIRITPTATGGDGAGAHLIGGL